MVRYVLPEYRPIACNQLPCTVRPHVAYCTTDCLLECLRFAGLCRKDRRSDDASIYMEDVRRLWKCRGAIYGWVFLLRAVRCIWPQLLRSVLKIYRNLIFPCALFLVSRLCLFPIPCSVSPTCLCVFWCLPVFLPCRLRLADDHDENDGGLLSDVLSVSCPGDPIKFQQYIK